MSATGKHRKRTSKFVPTNISGCALWLDCADSSSITISSGTSVSQIRDKSGNGKNASLVGGRTQPVTGTLNSIPAVNFSTSNSEMAVTIAFANQNKSCFVVFQHTANIFTQTGKFQNFLGLNQAQRLNFLLDGNTSNYTITLAPNSNVTNILSATASSSSYNFQNPTMIAAIQDTTAANNIITANGTTLTTSSNGTAGGYSTASTTLNLGRGSATNANYTVTWILGEYIQYDGYIGPTDRQKIEGYLAWKWGLVSNLPVGHPYKSAPPFV